MSLSVACQRVERNSDLFSPSIKPQTIFKLHVSASLKPIASLVLSGVAISFPAKSTEIAGPVPKPK
jgi:hypothetical protein